MFYRHREVIRRSMLSINTYLITDKSLSYRRGKRRIPMKRPGSIVHTSGAQRSHRKRGLFLCTEEAFVGNHGNRCMSMTPPAYLTAEFSFCVSHQLLTKKVYCHNMALMRFLCTHPSFAPLSLNSAERMATKRHQKTQKHIENLNWSFHSPCR
jgi:hypothetical protein